MPSVHEALRGSIWQVQLNPTRGREQSGSRPAMILSVDKLNKGPADLVIAIPITRTNRGIPSHIKVAAGEGGLDSESYIMVEQIRSISKERLLEYRGALNASTVASVERITRVLLGI